MPEAARASAVRSTCGQISTPGSIRIMPLLFISPLYTQGCLSVGEMSDIHAAPRLRMPHAFAIVSEELEGSTNLESIVLILRHVNNRNQFMVIMRPNEKIRYEVQAADTNHLASICGKRNADNFSQSTAEQGRSSYVDKEKSEELASQTRLQLPSGEAGLPLNGIIRAQASLARQKTLSAGGPRVRSRLGCHRVGLRVR